MGTTARVSPVAKLETRVCGAYVLDRFLRDGLLSTVYLARAMGEPDARFVARVIHPELAVHGARAPLLARAFETLKDLRIDGVPRVAAYDVTAARPVLVTARIDGHSVRDRLAAHDRMSPEDVSRMVTELARILDALHGHAPPIVHRSIQPENVLLDAGGGVWLDETGLAWALAEAGVLPEDVQQWLRPRTDVVMLATLAFRCISGTGLSGTAESMRDDGKSSRHATHGAHPSLPPAVDAVLLRGWNAEPNEQHATAGAFARDLALALTNTPPDAALTGDVDQAFDRLMAEPEAPAVVSRSETGSWVPLKSGRVPRARPTVRLAEGPKPPPLPRTPARLPAGDRPTVPMADPLAALSALDAFESRTTAPTPPVAVDRPAVPHDPPRTPLLSITTLLPETVSTAGVPAPAIDRVIEHAAWTVSASILGAAVILAATLGTVGGRVCAELRADLRAGRVTPVATTPAPRMLAYPRALPTAPSQPPTLAVVPAAVSLRPEAPTVATAPVVPPTVPVPEIPPVSVPPVRHPRPSEDALWRAGMALQGPVGDCVVGSDLGAVQIAVTYQATTGRVVRVEIPRGLRDPPTGPCLVSAVRAVTLPSFGTGTYTARFRVPVPQR